MNNFDFIVVGAGIAGASVAAQLAAKAQVALLEMEERPGYHTTGRSAAAYEPNYGPRPLLALSRAGIGFFKAPPPDFSETPVFTQRGSLVIEAKGQENAAQSFLSADSKLQVMSEAEMLALYPILRRGYANRGFYDDGTGDLDVGLLHQGFLKWFKKRGGRLACNAGAQAITKAGKLWQVSTPQGTFTAPVVINASGAWGDKVAAMAGVAPIGLTPKRRSMAVVAGPQGSDFMAWPFVVDCEESWYSKPQSGKLLVSSADATPVEPHDAYADDEAIAVGIDRFMTATTLEVTRVEHTWGGLRSFAPDKFPVCGFDPTAEGFFWLVGQGGNGIQSSDGLSRLAAALAQHEAPPADIMAQGLILADVLPERFRT
ncbi:MAG: FAD-binding oxidoreductase [Alphaproteobacteria bacterium]|nr:FAD-binding oxidoreductase [Alphaproteobacteria bacterium]